MNQEIEDFEEHAESMLGDIIENNNKIIYLTNRIISRCNLMLYLYTIGWLMLYILDPVRLIVSYPNNNVNVCVDI